MAPPTVPMPSDGQNDNQPETPLTEATTEAGTIDGTDEKGPKACAADTADAASAADNECGRN